jgi:hypothetical protein
MARSHVESDFGVHRCLSLRGTANKIGGGTIYAWFEGVTDQISGATDLHRHPRITKLDGRSVGIRYNTPEGYHGIRRDQTALLLRISVSRRQTGRRIRQHAFPEGAGMLLGVTAPRVEGKVEYDPVKMRITNNADANKYLKPYIRKGWSFAG